MRAKRFSRLRQRALRLNELVERCRASGKDPAEDPEVERIRHELANDYPDGAKTLLDIQEAIELELLGTLERRYGSSSRDALNRLIAITLQIRDDAEQPELTDALQDPAVMKLLTDYAQVTRKLMELLAEDRG